MSRMQDKINQSPANVYIGVDVGKFALDVFIHPKGDKLQYENNPSGIRKLLKHCQRVHPQLIALEATGKYHRLAHELLHDAGFDVAVINPFRSRQFADSMGKLAKTDTIDAKVIANFAGLMQPKPTIPPSKQHKTLRDLNVARRQVLDQIGDLSRQLGSTDHPLAASQIRARIKMAERHKEALEKEIKKQIQAQDDLKHKFNILTSIPGVGVITATTLLTDLNELGEVNSREISALAGLAPMNRDSGLKRGVRCIRGGRKYVRNMLYMCAVGQSRTNGSMGCFYRRLIAQGKNPKVALVAVARKIIILANTLITEDRCWTPTRP